MATAKMGSLSLNCAYKKVWCHMLKNVSKSLNKVRFQMWMDGENKSLNAEWLWNNILVKLMSISIEKYKIISFLA